MRFIRYALVLLVLGLLASMALAAPITQDDDECVYAPPPRLQGADAGQVAQSYSSLRADIGSQDVLVIMTAPAQFEITGDPVCSGPHYWYPITYDGVSGWAAEGYFDQYWLEPLAAEGDNDPEVTPEPPAGDNGESDPDDGADTDDGDAEDGDADGVLRDPVTGVAYTEATDACSGAPAPRLEPGDEAQVAQNYSSLRPGIHSNTVTQILHPGDTVEVVNGPFCAFGPYNWYEVEFGSVTGFVTEGTGEVYWLEPAT